PIFHFHPIATTPIVVDLASAPEAEARGAIGVVLSVDILFSTVVPPHGELVNLAVDLHGDLLVALTGGGGLKFGDPFLEIGAATSAEIGGFGSFFHTGYTAKSAESGSVDNRPF